MKLYLSPLVLIGLPAYRTAFTPTAFLDGRIISSFDTSTRLRSSTYTSSYAAYGIDDEVRKQRRGDDQDVDPEEDLLGYLHAPDSVAARPGLTGTVLVSGWVKSKERTDQLVFDFLNSEESAFGFEKIVAFVDDSKFAKKRLFSRSARYTGLSDKLECVQSESPGALPTKEQLEGVKHWVANVESDHVSMVKSIAALCAASPSLENVSLLLSETAGVDVSDAVSAIESLDSNSEKCSYSIIAVGKLDNHAEGSQPYRVADFGTVNGTIAEDATYSRDESWRKVTDCLALESAKNKALSFVEVTTDDTAAKLIKGLRQAGYTRPQEIDHMIAKGVKAYEQAIVDYKQKQWEKANPDPEEQKKIQEERDAQAALDWEKSEKEFDEKKKKDIEDNARSWAKREYFKRSMGGNMGMSEEEYIKSVWDRAMFEGDLKYRMMHGGSTDERKELAEFTKKQEAKKEAALKKAKAALEEKLGTVLKDDDVKDDNEGDDDKKKED